MYRKCGFQNPNKNIKKANMLKNKLYLLGTIGFVFALAIACKKELKYVATQQDTQNKAYLKIVHASPYFRKIFNTADTLQVYANNQKFSATSFSYGASYPSATGNGYAAVDPGVVNFDIFSAGKIKPDSAKVTTLSKTLAPNSHYSLILTDSIGSPRDSSQIWLNDNVEAPPASLYSLRLVHAVMNDTTGKAIDIYSARRNGNIFTNYLPGRSSGFAHLPFNQQVSDTLIVRRSGTTFELARINTISFNNQRVYTLVYRGNADSTPTAVARPRTLTYYVNK
jgi:hypothetical protein